MSEQAGPIQEPSSYYHLSGALLELGSIILPGNWGRVLTAIGWGHGQSLREMALEDARAARYPQRRHGLKRPSFCPLSRRRATSVD